MPRPTTFLLLFILPLLAVAASLLLPQVSAEPDALPTTFDVTITPAKTDLIPDYFGTFEQGSFTITVRNNQNYTERFRFSVGDVTWSVQSDPLSDYLTGLEVEPGQERTATFYVQPIGSRLYGQYKVGIVVKAEKSGVEKSSSVLFNMKPAKPTLKEYLFSVGKLVDVPSEIDPRNPAVITINLENRNPRNISSLLVSFSSRLINEKRTLTLGPFERKSVKVVTVLPPLTPPQDDELVVTFTVDDELLEPVIREPFSVTGYSQVKEQPQPLRTAFLRTEQEILYFNDGNIRAQKYVEKEVGSLQGLFTKTAPRAFTVNKYGRQYLAWELEIEPQGRQPITIVQDYRLLFIALLVLLASGLLYYVSKSPIVIRKEAVVVATQEGGISQMKVLIHIKNRTSDSFDSVTIADRIPSLVDLIKETEVGTMEPTRILKHEKEGNVVKWELGAIDRYEERIVSYRIRSKLSILGGMELPPALIKFVDKRGRERISRSNSARISG